MRRFFTFIIYYSVKCAFIHTISQIAIPFRTCLLIRCNYIKTQVAQIKVFFANVS